MMSQPADVLCSEAVVLRDLLSRRRRSEGVDTNDGDPRADEGLPPYRGTGLNDQDWHTRRQSLFFEQFDFLRLA